MQKEQLRGDPADLLQGPPETLDLTREQIDTIEKIERGPVPRGAEKNAQTLFIDFVLPAAAREADAGVSRTTDKDRVTEYRPHSDERALPLSVVRRKGNELWR